VTSHDIAFIGTGDEADLRNPGPEGFAMNYYHAEGYEKLDDCELVACADLVAERAEAFAARFDVGATFEDYEAMLAAAEPAVLAPAEEFGADQANAHAIHQRRGARLARARSEINRIDSGQRAAAAGPHRDWKTTTWSVTAHQDGASPP
jgi:hypothetical protein